MKTNSIYEQSVTCTNADEQYTAVLPRGTRQFEIHTTDDAAILRFSFTDAQVATPTGIYTTIPNGEIYFLSDLNLEDDTTIYIASDTDTSDAIIRVVT